MIVEKMWFTEDFKYNMMVARKSWRGWFLFGILPVYIKMIRIERFH